MENIKSDLILKIELINYKYKYFLLKKENNILNEKIFMLTKENENLKNDNIQINSELHNLKLPISISKDMDTEYLFEME